MSSYRIRSMKEIADRLEMSFDEKDEWGLLNLLSNFYLFRRGMRRKITNILSKDNGFEEIKVRIFDYHYVIRAGNKSKRVKQSVFFIQSKALALPEFWMQPEHFLHKIGNLIGFEDINFEEYIEFSDRYRLKGQDSDLIRDAFQEDVLHYFTLNKGWRLEGIGYYLILYKKDVIMPPSQITQLFREGMEVWRRFLK